MVRDDRKYKRNEFSWLWHHSPFFSPSIWLLLSQWSINRLSTIQMQTIDYSDKAEEPFSDVASLSLLCSSLFSYCLSVSE